MRNREVADYLGDTGNVAVVSIGSDQTPLTDDKIYSDLDPRYGARSLARRLGTTQPMQEVIAKLTAGEILPIDGYCLNRVVESFPPKTLTILQRVQQRHEHHNPFFFVGVTSALKPVDMLAALLDVDVKELARIVENPDGEYTKFPLKKKSGKKRWINAPSDFLKMVQVRIKDRILYKGWPTKYAHGFVNKRSIVTNANPHVGKAIVINMDIKGFFDTITDDMVRNALIQCLPQQYIILMGLVAHLCTIKSKGEDGTERRVTPQGAPTSPVLSNLVARYLDFSLKGVAQNFKAVYTRYADDMTFSSDNLRLTKAIPIIMKVVNDHGFWINTAKTNVFRRGGRQIVTGLVVNDKVSVPRQERMEFRAHLHHILTGKIVKEQVDLNKIQGYANYINMVNPDQGKYFLGKVAEIVEMINGKPKKEKKARCKSRKGKKS